MTDKVKVVTPVGELHWCNISGTGKKNYNEDGFVYTATIFLKGEAAEKLQAEIDAVLGDVPKNKKLKSKGYRDVYKNPEGKYFVETGNREATEDDTPTDLVAFQFTTNTTLPDGRQSKIDVYNSGKKTEANPSGKPQKINLGSRGIGNGSLGAISGVLKKNDTAKDVSISLFLKAIQLTKYIEYSGDAGFDAQEDGEFDGVESDGTEEFSSPEKEEDKAEPKKSKARPKI